MDPVSIAFVACGLAAAVLALLAWWDARTAARTLQEIAQGVAALRERSDNTERAIREEMKALRDETLSRDSHMRFELGQAVTGSSESLQNRIGDMARGLEERLGSFNEDQTKSASALKLELTEGLKLASGIVRESTETFGASQHQRLGEMKASIIDLTARLEGQQAAFGERLNGSLQDVTQKLQSLLEANEAKQNQLRDALNQNLETLRKDNEAKLEQMRLTVDEKLQGTLDKRLGESFLLVSERLESVHKGLGEMQTLATGVGDLKRVLTNVKSRGGWAEVQLGALLENMLGPDQYEKNVRIDPASQDVVEYAIKLPGDGGGPVLLPIDAKFPHEDYDRLLKAQERGEVHEVELAGVALANAIRREGKRISDKYIVPPRSTDFAVMYLPTEGLFAEVMRRTDLLSELQQRYKVTVAGPTTLTAFLTSLQMGFRTLAVQKRSSEVWQVLGEAKAEFEKYGQVWDKLHKHLETAQRTVEEAGRRTRAVARRLKTVETIDIPGAQLPALPGLDDPDDERGDADATAKIA